MRNIFKKTTDDNVSKKSDKNEANDAIKLEGEMANLCRVKLDEINTVAKIMGCETAISELDSGLPALFLAMGKNNKGQDRVVNCIPIPIIINQAPIFMIQFTEVIMPNIPKDKILEVEKLAIKLNKNFSFSTFAVYDDELSLKYSIYGRPDVEFDQVLIAKCLEIIITETENTLKLVDEIVSNDKKVEDLGAVSSLT